MGSAQIQGRRAPGAPAGVSGSNTSARRVEALTRAVERLNVLQETERAASQACFEGLAADLKVRCCSGVISWACPP